MAIFILYIQVRLIQVECARVAGNRNVTYVLPQPHEKSFLALMAIKVFLSKQFLLDRKYLLCHFAL